MKFRVHYTAATALLLALVLAGVWLVAPRLHGFAYWIERQDPGYVAALATEGWRLDALTAEPGVVLPGLVRPPQQPGANWILFLPGNSRRLAGAFRPVLDDVVAATGKGAAFWPWRGFDASGGEPDPDGLLQDARAAFAHLQKDLQVPPERIELWGYSLGSGIAVQLAAELQAAGTPPSRLVLLSAYDRIAVMRHGTFGRLLPRDRYEPIDAAPRVRGEVVMVHGSADDALPVAGARALAAALGGDVRFVELPGRGHVDYLRELRQLDL